ncbi:MAG: hypothetical protein AAFP26_07145 [Planctomycetota bacterium]
MPTFPRLSLDDVQAPPTPIPFQRREIDRSAPAPLDAASEALSAIDRVQSKLDELEGIVDEGLSPIPFSRDEPRHDDGPGGPRAA